MIKTCTEESRRLELNHRPASFTWFTSPALGTVLAHIEYEYAWKTLFDRTIFAIFWFKNLTEWKRSSWIITLGYTLTVSSVDCTPREFLFERIHSIMFVLFLKSRWLIFIDYASKFAGRIQSIPPRSVWRNQSSPNALRNAKDLIQPAGKKI